MECEYLFYKEDRSFDFGDFPNSSVTEYIPHGFSIDIGFETNDIDITTLKGFGDFEEMNNIKTLEELKQYLLDNFNKIDDIVHGLGYSNRRDFNTLIRWINENIERKVENVF